MKKCALKFHQQRQELQQPGTQFWDRSSLIQLKLCLFEHDSFKILLLKAYIPSSQKPLTISAQVNHIIVMFVITYNVFKLSKEGPKQESE